MISLMVVDDEELVIKGIRSILRRENHGYMIVGEARNGYEAIEVAKKKKPDLIITDICMPEMDGLAMVKKILEILPNTKFVVLSGFGEFNYAQEAVRLGVIDYILKPISSSGLYEMLDKIAGQIIASEVRKENEKREHIEKLLGEYIFNKVDGNREKLLEVLDRNTKYISELLTIEKGNYDGDVANEVIDWVKKFIYKDNYGIVIYRERGMFLLIDSQKKSNVSFINDAIIRQTRDHYDISIRVDSISEPDKIENVREMYRKLMISYAMRFYTVENKVNNNRNGVEMISIPIEMINSEIVDNLLECIEAENREEILKIMDEKINTFENLTINPKDLRRYFQGIIRICISQLQVKGYIKESFQEVLDEKISYINLSHTIGELRKNIEEIMNMIFDMKKDKIEIPSSRIIIEVKRYIMQNYYKEISLKEVAESVFISSKYLSDLFKRETGETFSSYLVTIRMENAKKALKRFDLKIYEVAESVGYSNPKHFVKVFKKYTGMSPLEYRNNS